jgi:hypothetical protein
MVVRSKFKIEKMSRPKKVYELTEKKGINDASNEMGFASSLSRDEKDNSFYIQSK